MIEGREDGEDDSKRRLRTFPGRSRPVLVCAPSFDPNLHRLCHAAPFKDDGHVLIDWGVSDLGKDLVEFADRRAVDRQDYVARSQSDALGA